MSLLWPFVFFFKDKQTIFFAMPFQGGTSIAAVFVHLCGVEEMILKFTAGKYGQYGNMILIFHTL